MEQLKKLAEQLQITEMEIESSEVIKERVVNEFSQHDTKGISFSLGIVDIGPTNFIGYEKFVKKADEKMYKAKNNSGMQISIFNQ